MKRLQRCITPVIIMKRTLALDTTAASLAHCSTQRAWLDGVVMVRGGGKADAETCQGHVLLVQ